MRTPANFTRLLIVLVFFLTTMGTAQEYDILIKNGHVIDSKNGIDMLMDVAIKDSVIAKVASNIPTKQGKTVIDAKGLYVSPGLI